MIKKWGIDPTWVTSQIVGYVHVHLWHKADRKAFEQLLPSCKDKADLIQLVHATLEAEDRRRAEQEQARSFQRTRDAARRAAEE